MADNFTNSTFPQLDNELASGLENDVKISSDRCMYCAEQAVFEASDGIKICGTDNHPEFKDEELKKI